jgi:hypothetical protein
MIVKGSWASSESSEKTIFIAFTFHTYVSMRLHVYTRAENFTVSLRNANACSETIIDEFNLPIYQCFYVALYAL